MTLLIFYFQFPILSKAYPQVCLRLNSSLQWPYWNGFVLGFQYQFGLEHELWKTGFSISGLEPKFGNPSFDTPEKQNVFNFQLTCFSAFFILFFVFVQASAAKPGICNLFLSYCFLMLSSKRRFSNQVFQNSCSNPYLWGVKIQVSKFGFKNDIENPKLEKLKFWSTLISPVPYHLWNQRIEEFVCRQSQ